MSRVYGKSFIGKILRRAGGRWLLSVGSSALVVLEAEDDYDTVHPSHYYGEEVLFWHWFDYFSLFPDLKFAVL